MAVSHGDQLVTSFSEKSRGGAAFRHSNGKLRFVAVGFVGGSRRDGKGFRLNPADAGEGVSHPLTLQFCFQRVVHVHQVAAAAASEVGTDRLHAMGRCMDEFL